MSLGLISLRIAQAIFITVIVILTIRHYTVNDTEYMGQQVRVHECTQTNPYTNRCINYIAILKDGALIIP